MKTSLTTVRRLFFTALALTATATAVTAQDAVVPTDFATIQAAVLSATDVDLNGSIDIQVLAGTYAEAILVLRDDISLTGEDAATTIIDGGGAANVIHVERSNRFSIQGFTVTSTGEANGLDFSRSDDATVAGNIFDGNRHGIRLDRSNNALVELNEVGASKAAGIKVTRSQGAIVMMNSVHDGLSTGIDIRGVASTQVDDNVLTNNLGTGIRIRRTDGANSVMGNTITGCLDNGMEIREAVSTLVLNNTISGGLSNGIRLRDTAQSLFSGNVVTGNQGYGVRMRDAVNDDWDDTMASAQPAPGNNDLSNNVKGEVRID